MGSSGRAFEYRERHPRRLLRMLALFLLTAAALIATVLLHRRFPAHDFLFLDILVIGLVTYLGGRLAGVAAALLAIAVAWHLSTSPALSPQAGRDLLTVDALFAFAALAMVAAGHCLRAIAHGQRLASAEQQFLANAGALMVSAGLDPLAPLSSLARFCVPTLADWCTMEIVDKTGVIETVAVAHQDPLKMRLLRDLRERYPPKPDDPRGAAAVIRSGRPELYEHISDAMLTEAARDGDHLEALRAVGFRSAVVVPIRGRGRVLGAMTFVLAESARRYGAADLTLGEDLGLRAGLAVESARSYEAERAAHEEAERARAVAAQAADRTERLQAITAALSQALTPAEAAGVVVDQGCKALGAQAAAMFLLNDDQTTLELVESHGYPEPSIERLRRIPLSDAIGIADAVKSWQAVVYRSAEGSPDSALHPAKGEVSGGLQDEASAAISLFAGGRPIGVLGFVFAQSHTIPTVDRVFMALLAHQCAEALERARQYERTRTIAETLQRAFLPANLPLHPSVAISAHYIPGTATADVGGDWYDVFRLPNNRIALSVGDVVGRGLTAAVMMGQIRQTIRAVALAGYGPSRVLREAAEVLRLTYEREGMATAIFGILDPDELTFTCATAGHPPPIVFVPNGDIHELQESGLPLGAAPHETPAPEHTRPLPPGGLLVLYTDGLIEFTRDIVAGEAALAAAVRAESENPSADPARGIVDRVLRGNRPLDDVAVITVRARPRRDGIRDPDHGTAEAAGENLGGSGPAPSRGSVNIV